MKTIVTYYKNIEYDVKSLIPVTKAIEIFGLNHYCNIYSPRYKTFIVEKNMFNINGYREFQKDYDDAMEFADKIYDFYVFLIEKKGIKQKEISKKISAKAPTISSWTLSIRKKIMILFEYRKYIKEFDSILK